VQDAGRRTQLLSASVGICIITIITLMCTASLCGGCSTCVCLFAVGSQFLFPFPFSVPVPALESYVAYTQLAILVNIMPSYAQFRGRGFH